MRLEHLTESLKRRIKMCGNRGEKENNLNLSTLFTIDFPFLSHTGLGLRKELAPDLGINNTRFSKSFKLSLGITFREYQLKSRLGKAVQLLESTHLSIKEITFQTGYSSTGNFSRSFKHYTGIPPTQCREYLWSGRCPLKKTCKLCHFLQNPHQESSHKMINLFH